jgi:c-di-GMP-binding flagellar brake protein YcgR
MKPIGHSGFTQREFMRIPVSIEAEVIVVSPDGTPDPELWAANRILEIGGGGLRLEEARGARMGSVLSIRFALPDSGENLKVYGRVVDTGESGVSVKFVGMSQAEQAALIRFCFREQIRGARWMRMVSEPPGEER